MCQKGTLLAEQMIFGSYPNLPTEALPAVSEVRISTDRSYVIAMGRVLTAHSCSSQAFLPGRWFVRTQTVDWTQYTDCSYLGRNH